MLSDKDQTVLNAYTLLVESVSEFITSLYTETEADSVSPIARNLAYLSKEFGVNAEEVVKVLREHNDIPAQATELESDELLYVRITGTLFAHLSNIASVIYDVEQGVQALEVFNEMLGTLLILQEVGYE